MVLFVGLQDTKGEGLFGRIDFLVFSFQLIAVVFEFIHSGGEFSHLIGDEGDLNLFVSVDRIEFIVFKVNLS